MSVEHADIQVKSYSLHSRERYICNSGFKRKAGTSSLTECVLNKATNIAYWTTPSLKCIRDPALARQRPAPPSTVTTAGVTPQPESFSPSGKERHCLKLPVSHVSTVFSDCQPRFPLHFLGVQKIWDLGFLLGIARPAGYDTLELQFTLGFRVPSSSLWLSLAPLPAPLPPGMGLSVFIRATGLSHPF
ncbi:hypothetical protein P7K49_015018 [Saguinus oedipus]|uniref:Sushi domain-containing protein n=1 Tax=Saguinus oedipus TaxID=9490 RepID=A0ABQ9V9A4_SAGOE|nr:hypothetical protein P7K49_015018 [Saguinus oedipus]